MFKGFKDFFGGVKGYAAVLLAVTIAVISAGCVSENPSHIISSNESDINVSDVQTTVSENTETQATSSEETENKTEEAISSDVVSDKIESSKPISSEAVSSEAVSSETVSSETVSSETASNKPISSEATTSNTSSNDTAPSDTTSKEEPVASPPPRVVVIKAYSPYQAQNYAAGSSFTAIISARPDSNNVTATFNGQTIRLEKQTYVGEPEFVNFAGKFTLPYGNKENKNLGKITYYAEWNGHSETYQSPDIICLKDPEWNLVTVVEVVAESAETFNGNTVDDNSDPRLSPLPKGTVDYQIGDVIFDKKSEKYYYKLRCGRRVYLDKKNSPDTNKYQVTVTRKGKLPSSNQININTTFVSGGHTYMTVDTAWKAPFAVTVGSQHYNNLATRDFTVQSVTCKYVDIKFYYTTAIGGNVILPDNPLFYHAEAIPQAGGAILRLHLKKTGGFYGWNAYYNAAGQLEFKFLNPKSAIAADNKYGANLTGITVMLDAGHGGRDLGALGLDPAHMPEAERNLALTYKVKAELESIGATVVLTRKGGEEVTTEKRCSLMRSVSPDLCVSIHHDASENDTVHGASFYCFNPFSHNATQKAYARTLAANIYRETAQGWHYFYMGRVTSCPLVLIENGYISNLQDFYTINNEPSNNQKAYNITLGIADYFLSVK